jgi:hypothetical protein
MKNSAFLLKRYFGKPAARMADAVLVAGLLILCAAVVLITGCALPLGEDYVIENPLKMPGETNLNSSYVIDYDLQHYIPVPMAGEKPVTSITRRLDLEVEVVWKDAAGQVLPETFSAFVQGGSYQADITLSVKNAYIFKPDQVFAYDQKWVVSQTGEDNTHVSTRTVTVVYQPAAGTGSI